MGRRLIILALAAGLLTVSLQIADARGRKRGRIILGFDRASVSWTVFARLRTLPTASPVAVWDVKGEAHCNDHDTGRCPGERASLVGSFIANGQTFTLSARFANGVTCTFADTLPEPNAPGTTVCTTADGSVVLSDTLHVGLCRCHRGRLCRPNPCPF